MNKLLHSVLIVGSDMKLVETEIQGLFLLENPVHRDERGIFFKPYEMKDLPETLGRFIPQEIYYSSNHRQVIRGMHFQTPPYDHTKIVWVSAGRILDVVLDIRRSSKTYGKWYSIDLDCVDGIGVFIPPGFAHGFLSLEDGSIVNYAQTSAYKKEYDRGIRYDSFGFLWPEPNPVVSERDMSFPMLKNYSSEF